ncbi:MAG: type II toxin-antitoxin system RelE/ParE family toxin [Spirosomataceae bacterium]
MAGSGSYAIIILDGADKDIEQGIDWYETQKTGLGFEFYQAFLTTTHTLATSPFLYQEHFLFVRKASLHRFPYSVFYAIDEVNAVVEIIAVFHQRMSPEELKHRLNFE